MKISKAATVLILAGYGPVTVAVTQTRAEYVITLGPFLIPLVKR